MHGLEYFELLKQKADDGRRENEEFLQLFAESCDTRPCSAVNADWDTPVHEYANAKQPLSDGNPLSDMPDYASGYGKSYYKSVNGKKRGDEAVVEAFRRRAALGAKRARTHSPNHSS